MKTLLVMLAIGLLAVLASMATAKSPAKTTVVRITACTPAVLVGYVLIEPPTAEKGLYVGRFETLTDEEKDVYKDLAERGEAVLGELSFPSSCPATQNQEYGQ